VKLDQYISELLFEHECVIIPGFGGIVANYRPSSLNPAHHTFSPPSKRLAFNASLRTNDGLLASHLSKKLSVNYSEANSYISAFVNDCVKSLQNGQKLVLDKVGVLYMDGEKNLQFMPEAGVNYLKASFGLTSLHSPAIRREDTLNIPVSQASRKRVVKIGRWRIMEVIPVAAILTYLIINPSIVTSLNQQLASLNPFSKPAVIDYKGDKSKDESKNAILNDDTVFAIGSDKTETAKDTATVSAEEISPDVTATVKEEAPVINLKPNVFAETPEKKDEVEYKEEAKETKIDKTEVKKEAVTNEVSSRTSRRYYVIGGCFMVEENATKFLSASIANGYKAEIIGKNNKGMTMVSLFSTDNAAEASQQMAAIKEKEADGAWMLRK
jgi:hypothetical protein